MTMMMELLVIIAEIHSTAGIFLFFLFSYLLLFFFIFEMSPALETLQKSFGLKTVVWHPYRRGIERRPSFFVCAAACPPSNKQK